MKLTETGESLIRGYLFVLGRSLRSFLAADVAADAVREVESHIRERADEVAAVPDERAALQKVLAEMGPPLRVAQAYASEMTLDEAVSTGRVHAVARAVWHMAVTTVHGFAAAFALLVGYLTGLTFLTVAVLKPIFPQNVGLVVVDGVPRSLGAVFPPPPGAEVRGGYWIVPICLLLGLAVLVATHRGARAILARWRARRSSWRDESGSPAQP
jgi:uncharacterized membrane protein